MEISSFPYCLSPPDDFSQFFPELESPTPLLKRRRPNNNATLDTNDLNNTINNDNKSNTYFNSILASLLVMDETVASSSAVAAGNSTSDPHLLVTSSSESDHKPHGQEPVPANESESVESRQQQRGNSNNNKRGRTTTSDAATAATTPVVNQRRLWVKDRSKDWWERCSHPDFPEEEFQKAFRMSKSTFEMICEELDPVITKKDTTLRAAIPVRQRVAVCVWRLATGEPLRLVSKRFGLGISTCHKLILEVCAAIKTNLMPKFLNWPDSARMGRVKAEFEAVSGIPNVGGSMYTTHIPIIAPKASVGAYFNKRHTERNQKTSYSITVQGVVDPNGVFTDVCIGWPGSMPDDQVLEKSALYQRATRGLLTDVWIVGSSNYPLMDWVLVPYAQKNLTWTQHAFNEKIGEVQGVASGAFSRLKARWGCLQKRTEVKLQDLPVVLGACCVLHNICEMRKEGIDHELEEAFELFDDVVVPENCVRSGSAVQARDHIAHNLLHHGLGGTAFL